ncbi:MAG TPA: hypothetical protein VMS87_07715 [Roseiarcus sp.]|nr:hypothetical protein [Roseiarcus sp.]
MELSFSFCSGGGSGALVAAIFYALGGAILRLGRHLGFIALLLAALLTAKAEAREFFASSAPADVRFVYAPDQSAPDSWLGLLLRQTGMDIWFVLMRDLL